MARKQILIALGMAAAVAACLAVLFALRLGEGPPVLDPAGPGERLAFAARWLLAPAVCLLAGVGFTANRRFFSAEAIDGEREVADRAFEINLRYNQNTLEQTVLAAIAWCGLALTLAPQDLKLIPALAGLFVAGRAAFWLGYLYAPWARAFGLGLTFYPTAVALVWLALRLA